MAPLRGATRANIRFTWDASSGRGQSQCGPAGKRSNCRQGQPTPYGKQLKGITVPVREARVTLPSRWPAELRANMTDKGRLTFPSAIVCPRPGIFRGD
jgi:hypothetical protein